ncbi:hypothetical protein DYC54_10575 [Vibrio cholerae]|nr:hypothetical protein [Vibrio cholerae]EGR2500718.1 hypothetical protein [Vibrio cholerae]TXZ13401.1 hypothetical protein FXE59_16190 [Vibrio cholerae]TXZ45593.1 hypothetical protein FXE58_03890 [Vibrio cholerae]
MHSTQFHNFFMVLNQKNLFLPTTHLKLRRVLNYIVDNNSHSLRAVFYELFKMAKHGKSSRPCLSV